MRVRLVAISLIAALGIAVGLLATASRQDVYLPSIQVFGRCGFDGGSKRLDIRLVGGVCTKVLYFSCPTEHRQVVEPRDFMLCNRGWALHEVNLWQAGR